MSMSFACRRPPKVGLHTLSNVHHYRACLIRSSAVDYSPSELLSNHLTASEGYGLKFKPCKSHVEHLSERLVPCRVQGANARVDPDPVKSRPAEAEPSPPSGQLQKQPRVNIFSGESPAGESDNCCCNCAFDYMQSVVQLHNLVSNHLCKTVEAKAY